MTKRKSKAKQKAVAEEVTEQRLRLKLQRQIATLKRLPKDFRDITLGTEWEAFADITGRREEMDKWYHGPIVHFAPLNKHEEMILGSPNRLIPMKTSHEAINDENWIMVLENAERLGASWIYLPDEESTTIDALNVLFSRFGFNIRAKGQLMSEHSGKPVGVVR